MESRIERLEASVRRWQIISISGLVCVLVAVLLGAGAGVPLTYGLVRVRQLEVVDQDGKVMINLTTSRDSVDKKTLWGAIAIHSSTGQRLLDLGSCPQPTGGGLVTLYNRQGKTAVVMSSTDALTGDVTVYDAQGANRSLGIHP